MLQNILTNYCIPFTHVNFTHIDLILRAVIHRWNEKIQTPLCILKGLSDQILRGLFWRAWINLDVKRSNHRFLKFSVAASIFGGYFNVSKRLIPKLLGDDGFTNFGCVSGRFHISLSENCFKSERLSRRWINKLAILLGISLQIWQIFLPIS